MVKEDTEYLVAAVESFSSAFQVDGIILITDASFYKGAGGWAFVAYHKGKVAVRSGKTTAHSSAYAELVASSKALEFPLSVNATTTDQVWVVSDSLYVQGAIRSGRVWLRHRSNVPNVHQIEEITSLVSRHEAHGRFVHCLHVKGHSGIVVNEYVDKLAGKARVREQ